MNESFDSIKYAIDQILNVSATVRRKKHTKKQQNKDLFISIITSMEEVINRTDLLYADLRLDYSSYDESFLQIIDSLMILHFGSDSHSLITFYLWERINPDGTVNELLDANGTPVIIESPYDLWNIIIKINPELDK
jgi:hypothetical protein